MKKKLTGLTRVKGFIMKKLEAVGLVHAGGTIVAVKTFDKLGEMLKLIQAGKWHLQQDVDYDIQFVGGIKRTISLAHQSPRGPPEAPGMQNREEEVHFRWSW